MTQHRSGAGAPEAVWDWDLAAGRMHASPRWYALVGCAPETAASSRDTWLSRVHPADIAGVTGAIDTHVAGAAAAFDAPHRLRHADGSYRWTSCHITVHRDDAGRARRLSGTHVDVTAAAITDPQTGLPNALLLDEHLDRSIDRARRYPGFHFALLVVDVERVAPATADAGTRDSFLAAVARRLETCIRHAERPRSLRHDDLVTRLDGDRFAILVDGLKEIGHVTVVADRVLAELAGPFTLKSGETFVAASIGVAVSLTGYTRPADVRRDAEIALHRARLLGGGRSEVFDVALLQAARTELQFESEFDGALERGEFKVFYQPIVALADGRIVGFEALVRWQHPVLGLIAPADFIPLAERTGFIVALGRFVLRTACAQLAAWREQPDADAMWIAVNVSTLQIDAGTFGGEVEAALDDAGLPANRLALEITESVAVERPADVRGELMRLRARGVRLSIDDFGTGHSSLASLQQLPVDALKADRLFARGLERDADTPEMLRAVLHMARQLGLHVVVEGLETLKQLDAARAIGVEYGQGYVFAPALAVEAATQLLRDGLPPPVAARPEASPRRQRVTALGVAAALLLAIAGAFAVGAVSRTADQSDAVGPAPVPRSPSAPAAVAAPAGPATAPSRSGPAEAGSSASRPPSSLRVVHQHRVGSCRGRLVAAAGRVRYVPDEAGGDDGFDFAPGQFLHQLDDGVLTVRSNQRTYRFRPADAVERGGGDAGFRALVVALSRRP
jgi:diguanylate cyclase (GGDEF)-like protein